MTSAPFVCHGNVNNGTGKLLSKGPLSSLFFLAANYFSSTE